MREKTQAWISASNREESMARVLSRAGLHEGMVLHAHRAASCALTAVLEDYGWAPAAARCADLCATLDAHGIAPTPDVTKAAQALDQRVDELNLAAAGDAPARSCDAKVAAQALDGSKTIRAFVNERLSH